MLRKEAFNLARIGNRYITECEPWKVWKTDPKRVETTLNISLQLVANLAIAFEPFLPFLCALFDWWCRGPSERVQGSTGSAP